MSIYPVSEHKLKVAIMIAPLIQLVLISLYVADVFCFPNGAPHKACANLYPKHGGVDAQTPPAGLSGITVSQSSYSPGDVLTVTLRLNPVRPFKGFLLLANRVSGDTEENVGRFVNPGTEVKPLFWYPQQDGYENCVTQVDPSPKQSVQLSWTSPISVGDIVFKATFVIDKVTFYVDVRSPVITALVPSSDPPFNSSVGMFNSPLEVSGACGQSKGCLLFPSYCSGDDCTYVVTYKSTSDGVEFEVKAKSIGYVTMALSEDKFMGDDLAVTCTYPDSGQYVSVQHGWNPAYFNDKHRITALTKIEAKREDGYVYCRWLHPYSVSHTHLVSNADGSISKVNVQFDLNDNFHIFVAWGKLYAQSDTLGKHAEHPIVSDRRVDLASTHVVRGGSLPLEMKIHATLAVLAWMLCVGIGTIVARHFRERFSSTRSGTADWFQVHRSLNIITAIFTLASFIIIFVKLKKWTTYSPNHAIVGTIVTGLMVVQMIAGFARPGPESSRRHGFNWFHRIAGKVTHILSGVTFMLALYSSIINEQLQRVLTIVFAVWIGLQVLWELVVFEVIKQTSGKKNVGIDDGYNSKTAVFNVKEGTLSKPSDTGLTVAFSLYIVSIIAITVTSISFIWLF